MVNKEIKGAEQHGESRSARVMRGSASVPH